MLRYVVGRKREFLKRRRKFAPDAVGDRRIGAFGWNVRVVLGWHGEPLVW